MLDAMTVRNHARNRLAQQTRMFCLLYLLRVRSILDAKAVTDATTVYQSGKAGPGQQAAHWIISSPAIGGSDLETILAAHGSGLGTELNRLLVKLLSQTTYLPKIYNEADSFLEVNGLRDKVKDISRGIISFSYQRKDVELNYKARMFNAYQQLRNCYVQLCADGRAETLANSNSYAGKLDILHSQADKIPAKGIKHYKEQLRKNAMHADDSIVKSAVLRLYQQIAVETRFPLEDAEMDEIKRQVDALP
ncbi:hypothetical protein ACMGDM_15510 [Sphingomonas sp. DT-51]|uniref:hypothetical protein n=1 Tax=Sphingomonas sp. DT-51 TaxID=3396165 RepID=UPI003F1D4226